MRSRSFLLLSLVVPLLSGCAASSFPADATARPVAGVPPLFQDPGEDVGRPAAGPEGCRSPLVDPRDGTRLKLVRSMGGRGDYEPEERRYGLSADELLRVDCASGRPVGAVPR